MLQKQSKNKRLKISQKLKNLSPVNFVFDNDDNNNNNNNNNNADDINCVLAI